MRLKLLFYVNKIEYETALCLLPRSLWDCGGELEDLWHQLQMSLTEDGGLKRLMTSLGNAIFVALSGLGSFLFCFSS